MLAVAAAATPTATARPTPTSATVLLRSLHTCCSSFVLLEPRGTASAPPDELLLTARVTPPSTVPALRQLRSAPILLPYGFSAKLDPAGGERALFARHRVGLAARAALVAAGGRQVAADVGARD